MGYKTCVSCGIRFRCKLAEKCDYWLIPNNCECDKCNSVNKNAEDCGTVFRDVKEKVMFT